METFTATQLQSKLATVFNSVQSNGCAYINGRSRPEMVLMLKDEHDDLINKLTQLIKLNNELKICK